MEAVSLCVTVQGRVTQHLWTARDFVFSGALATAATIFHSFPKVENQSQLLPPFIAPPSCGHQLCFGNHLHQHPVCLHPPFISDVYLFFLSLAFLPHFSFPPNHEWAGLSLVWHHCVFPMHLPQSRSDVRQISLQWACSHCLYSLIDAGMLEVTHESDPLSMLTPDTPLKPLIVCASGCEVQLRVVLCLYCPALHLLIECCFEMLTLYKRKKKKM